MVNASEPAINLVKPNRLKMLTSLNQKVSGWMPPFRMEAHGQNAAGG